MLCAPSIAGIGLPNVHAVDGGDGGDLVASKQLSVCPAWVGE